MPLSSLQITIQGRVSGLSAAGCASGAVGGSSADPRKLISVFDVLGSKIEANGME